MSTITVGYDGTPENIGKLVVNRDEGNVFRIDIETEYRSQIQLKLDIEQAKEIYSALGHLL